MLIILAFIILFHLIGVVLLFVATIHNAWWVVTPVEGQAIYTDLWYSCNATCYPVEASHSSEAAYLQVVQAAMILGTILCCVSFFVFILQLFRLKQGERFIFTAIIQLLASVCFIWMKRLPSSPASSGASEQKIGFSQSEVQKLIKEEIHSAIKSNETKLQGLIESVQQLACGVDCDRSIHKLEARINMVTKKAEAALAYLTRTQKKTPLPSLVNVHVIGEDSGDDLVNTTPQNKKSMNSMDKDGELLQMMETTKKALKRMRADNEGAKLPSTLAQRSSVYMTTEKVKGSGVFPDWKIIGEVKAITLPMCVMITKYKLGHKLCVAVVGKDTFGRYGPYSKVVSAAIPD
ncbi:Epithelial membrane protein 2 [Channa argus]|uniref:Epithelial membrane protein 2 n=1 Tax=Channa argus TaxID=215402 RepID=A0A6G1QCH7_CHAAH|nr:Epithelial membrane protein 2 [Channa argus]